MYQNSKEKISVLYACQVPIITHQTAAQLILNLHRNINPDFENLQGDKIGSKNQGSNHSIPLRGGKLLLDRVIGRFGKIKLAQKSGFR